MNISLKGVLQSAILLLVMFLSIGQSAHAETYYSSATGGIACPEGFEPIPSGLACVAVNLASGSTADIPPPQDCPEGFERPPGVRFCIASNLTLEIQNEVILLAQRIDGDCPEGFSRPVGSTICTADNLLLDVIDNEVKLVEYIPRCPKGFYKPVGSRFCVPENLTLKTLPAPPPADCPPGFIKPPGVHFCIASNMLYQDERRQNDLLPPQGLCPEGWYKPKNVRFCIPTHETSGCGTECATLKVPAIKMVNTIDDYIANPCPAGTVEIWWDMPVYDEDGLFVIDHIATRMCIPENLEPAG